MNSVCGALHPPARSTRSLTSAALQAIVARLRKSFWTRPRWRQFPASCSGLTAKVTCASRSLPRLKPLPVALSRCVAICDSWIDPKDRKYDPPNHTNKHEPFFRAISCYFVDRFTENLTFLLISDNLSGIACLFRRV